MEFESILSESQSEVLTANTKVTPKKTGRGTWNQTMVYRLKADYFITKLYPQTNEHFLHKCTFVWQGIQESNLYYLSQSQVCYHYTNPHQNPKFLKSNKTKNPLDFHLRGFGKYTVVSLSTCQTPTIILNCISKLWA
jgi:hypothetical protein